MSPSWSSWEVEQPFCGSHPTTECHRAQSWDRSGVKTPVPVRRFFGPDKQAGPDTLVEQVRRFNYSQPTPMGAWNTFGTIEYPPNRCTARTLVHEPPPSSAHQATRPSSFRPSVAQRNGLRPRTNQASAHRVCRGEGMRWTALWWSAQERLNSPMAHPSPSHIYHCKCIWPPPAAEPHLKARMKRARIESPLVGLRLSHW